MDLIVPNELFTSLFGCIAKATEIIVISVWVLFCVITWTTVHLFRCLNSNLLQIAAVSSTNKSETYLTSRLIQWSRRHQTVCELVEQVNSFFGWILLLMVTHSFVTLIVDSFEITMFFNMFDIFNGLVFLGRLSINVLRFSTVCYGCWLLESEVYAFC